MGWRDVRVRYVETTLGPFWSTLALFTVVVGSSVTVSVLSGQELFANSVLLALKLTVWGFLFNSLSEASDAIRIERILLLNSQVSEEILILRILWRNFLFYLHNLLVVLVFMILTDPRTVIYSLLLIPFGVIVALLLLFPCLLLALVGVRKRDVGIVVPSILQLIFFVSPVLWSTPTSGMGKNIALVNPVAWVLELSTSLGLTGSFNPLYASLVIIATIVSYASFELLRTKRSSVRNFI